MRILYDHQIFVEQEYGGVSRYFCAVAAEVGRQPGVSTRVVAPLHVNQHLRAEPGLDVTGWYVRPRKGVRRLLQAVSGRAFPVLAAGVRADVVHETYYARRPTAPSARRRVLTVFDMIHELSPESFPPGNVVREDKAAALARADHVICISESTRRDLLAHYPVPEGRVTVTHLGFARLPTPPPRRSGEGERPYLLYVGMRPAYKNFLGLARGVAASPRLRREFRIVCFGGGAPTARERVELAELGFSGDDVAFVHGGDDVLSSLYAGAAAFVYPSLLEGFGIPPLEAMSAGCPVVCSDASSIPEVVGPAGQYFDPRSPESIAGAVEAVVGSPARRAELVSLGRSRCATFTWEECGRRTLAVYRTVAG